VLALNVALDQGIFELQGGESFETLLLGQPFPPALGFPGWPLKVYFVASTILSLLLVSCRNFPTSSSLLPLV
jgi:hypothetical protein